MRPGGVGYKSDIDPINDLTNSTIDNAVIMHAVKVIFTYNAHLHRQTEKKIDPESGSRLDSVR